MKTYIYTLSNPLTNEVRYVGKTVNPKQRKHNHTNKARDRGTYKRNWINQLRTQGLRPKFDIIDEVEDDWKFWERYWIIQCRAWGFNLCNHTEGGDGLSKANQTSFKKGQISWNRGKSLKPETVELLRIASTGRIASEATLKRRSESMKKVVRSEQHLKALIEGGKITQFKPGTSGWKKERSGYKLSGLKQSKPVLQYDLQGTFIREFLGCKEAAEAMGCIPENIRLTCVGKNKTAKGFIWKYKLKKN